MNKATLHHGLDWYKFVFTDQEKRWKESRLRAFGFAKYADYTATDHWRRLRQFLFEKRGRVCEACETDIATAVHHITYQHVCDEREEELALLCASCHSSAHYPLFVTSRIPTLRKR